MGLVELAVTRLSVTSAALLAVGCLSVYYFIVRLNQWVRLRRTGGVSAPSYRGYMPFAFDLVIRTLLRARRNQNREMWEGILGTAGGHTAETRIMGRRIIFTVDPENIKAILATQFSDYGKGEPFHRDFKPFLGDSIFATDGPKWHASRQLLRPQFVKDRVSNLHTFEGHLQTLFTAMSVGGDAATTAAVIAERDASGKTYTGSANGRVIDMSDLFFRYTLDVATDFLLGKDTQSLTIPRQEFAEAFNEVQRVQSLISRTAAANWIIPRGSYYRGIKVMDEFVNIFIEKALLLPPEELEKQSHDDGIPGSDIKGNYTFLHELARFTRDRKVLRDQIVAVLLAGRDTTAGTLSWAIYELSKHPDAVKRLRAEIAEHVGVEGSSSKLYRPPTYADLKEMRYLQHVLNETLRLYPSVPFNVRLALKDTTLPRGGGPDRTQPVAVLKDTFIGYSTLIMQRRHDLYPTGPGLPGPEDFEPDRWDHWQPKPWHYIPFNGGPRICIGQQFALTEMGYVLVRLFQKFARVESHMQPIDGGKPRLKSDIVLQHVDGVHVAFYEE